MERRKIRNCLFCCFFSFIFSDLSVFWKYIVKSFFAPIFYYLLPGRSVTKIELITLDTLQPMCFSLFTVTIIHSIRRGTKTTRNSKASWRKAEESRVKGEKNQVDTLKILRKGKGKEVQKKKLIDT